MKIIIAEFRRIKSEGRIDSYPGYVLTFSAVLATLAAAISMTGYILAIGNFN